MNSDPSRPNWGLTKFHNFGQISQVRPNFTILEYLYTTCILVYTGIPGVIGQFRNLCDIFFFVGGVCFLHFFLLHILGWILFGRGVLGCKLTVEVFELIWDAEPRAPSSCTWVPAPPLLSPPPISPPCYWLNHSQSGRIIKTRLLEEVNAIFVLKYCCRY